MNNHPELFTPAEVGDREPRPIPKGGYPARPGTGPAGETCRTCRHLRRTTWRGKAYFKCGLVRATHGAGTDIRAGADACREWGAAQPKGA